MNNSNVKGRIKSVGRSKIRTDEAGIVTPAATRTTTTSHGNNNNKRQLFFFVFVLIGMLFHFFTTILQDSSSVQTYDATEFDTMPTMIRQVVSNSTISSSSSSLANIVAESLDNLTPDISELSKYLTSTYNNNNNNKEETGAEAGADNELRKATARDTNEPHSYHHVPSTEAIEHTIRRHSSHSHSRHENNSTNNLDDGSVVAPHTNRHMHTTTNTSNTTLPSRVVPGNKIFVTSPLVAEDIIENNLRLIPPEFEIHIFNNSAMAQSVQLIARQLASSTHHPLQGVWEAWSALRPWAYRADLWRLLILWSEGGCLPG